MGFREKNAWFCLVSILVVFVPYFYFSFQYPMEHISVFLITVVGLILLLAGCHAINAIATNSNRESGAAINPDELDKLIELGAAKWAGVVLAATVLIWCWFAMLSVPIDEISSTVNPPSIAGTMNELGFTISPVQGLFWVNLLFAGFVVSNLIYYGKIIVSYRGISNG